MIPVAREMPATGRGPLDDRAAVAIVGQNRPDVAREALKIARFESRTRPVLLVDLLGQGSALDEMFGDEDLHGVSDAARYGVSLGRVARPIPDAKSLFVVPGGTESPHSDDVLSDHLWGSWSDQCRRAGALLVVAAPADLPAVGKALDQLDGVVMIGDAAVPATHVPVIGRVRATQRVAESENAADTSAPAKAEPVAEATSAKAEPVAEATPEKAEPVAEAMPAKAEPVAEATPARATSMLGVAIAVVGTASLLAGLWWANARLQRSSSADARNASASQPIAMPGDPVTIAAASAGVVGTDVAVPWSVEIASLNTFPGAMARVRQTLDSLPVPTFAASHPAGGYATWYRLLAGAFTSSAGADSLLGALRARGAIEPAAGRVVQTPLAWLLEEGVLDEQLPLRLFGWRQQGLPAYGLVDRNGTTRIYFGAFENEAEARLFTPMLDSLNLYATLAKRIGSVR